MILSLGEEYDDFNNSKAELLKTKKLKVCVWR